MGQEIDCTVRFEKKVSPGKALLETEHIIFRGDERLKIPLNTITSFGAKDGVLSIVTHEGTAHFELGEYAAKWEAKIRNPKSLIDKLGVKITSVVSVAGVADEHFLQQLHERTKHITFTLQKDSDIIFYGVEKKEELKKLLLMKKQIKNDGAVWVIYRKGKQATVKETEIMQGAKDAGLVDVKVSAFSGTHTALKLVIPVAQRTS